MQRSTILLSTFVLLMLTASLVTRINYRIDSQNLAARPTGFAIDVNTADADALAILPSVGPGLAHRIVDYRTAHGAFGRVEDLRSVSGVGDRTLQRVRPFVTCGPAALPQARSDRP